jgi:hypothetical protein
LAGLFAKALAHSTSPFQVDRYREQARSPRFVAVIGSLAQRNARNPTSKLFMPPGKAGIMAGLRRCGVP